MEVKGRAILLSAAEVYNAWSGAQRIGNEGLVDYLFGIWQKMEKDLGVIETGPTTDDPTDDNRLREVYDSSETIVSIPIGRPGFASIIRKCIAIGQVASEEEKRLAGQLHPVEHSTKPN